MLTQCDSCCLCCFDLIWCWLRCWCLLVLWFDLMCFGLVVVCGCFGLLVRVMLTWFALICRRFAFACASDLFVIWFWLGFVLGLCCVYVYLFCGLRLYLIRYAVVVLFCSGLLCVCCGCCVCCDVLFVLVLLRSNLIWFDVICVGVGLLLRVV